MPRTPDGRAFTRPGQPKVNRDLKKGVDLALRRTVDPKPAPPALVQVQPTEPPGPVGTAWLDTSVQA